MKHTPTPWHVLKNHDQVIIHTENGSYITHLEGSHHISKEDDVSNAQRIVDCVNAFEFIEDPKAYMETVNEITRMCGEAANERDRLKEQLKAAMIEIQELLSIARTN